MSTLACTPDTIAAPRNDPARHFVFLADPPAPRATVEVVPLPPRQAPPSGPPVSDPASTPFFEALMTRGGLEARRYRPAVLERWFEPHADGRRGERRVGRELRERVRWWVGDAFALPSGEPWDVILCRNLAIYLEPGSVQELWARLAHVLVPGGILVVGKAERPQAGSGFRRERPCLYRRVEAEGAC